MKDGAKLCLIFLLVFTIAPKVSADDGLYAKAKQVAEEFPERITGFSSDPVLMMREENRHNRLMSLEKMYYRDDGELVTIIMRDFSENTGLYNQEKQDVSRAAPDDVRVLVEKPFRYADYDGGESITVFLDNFITFEIIHVNKSTDYSVLAWLLGRIDLNKINEMDGIN